MWCSTRIITRRALIYFFFNDTATTEIYTLSLHDALPICPLGWRDVILVVWSSDVTAIRRWPRSLTSRASSTVEPDRKSTRLNSSHANISYAVFCLKKKKKDDRSRNHSMLVDNMRRGVLIA